jgi:hypothetical protein
MSANARFLVPWNFQTFAKKGQKHQCARGFGLKTKILCWNTRDTCKRCNGCAVCFYDRHSLTFWISPQQPLDFLMRDSSLVERLCFQTWPCLDSYQSSYRANTRCTAVVQCAGFRNTSLYSTFITTRTECGCKWADLLYAESYCCVSGYFKTQQWANTGYTKCYWFLSMHPTESTEMRCQQVILGLWRDTSHNSNCLVSSFFTVKRPTRRNGSSDAYI